MNKPTITPLILEGLNEISRMTLIHWVHDFQKEINDIDKQILILQVQRELAIRKRNECIDELDSRRQG